MDFIEIINSSSKMAKELLRTNKNQKLTEEVATNKTNNLLYNQDNIPVMLDLLNKGYEGKIDLVYLDPPFFTNLNFYSKIDLNINGTKHQVEYLNYKDIWNGGLEEYLGLLTLRLILIRLLLSDKGSIYVHLDFRTAHYVKIIMDYIFGYENFLNEIIWSYKSGGSSKRHYSRKHDTILFYSKSQGYIFNLSKEKSYNRDYRPYGFNNIDEYEDEKGWYTLVNLRDVWEINMVGRTSRERVNYRTQKPEELMERIILSSTNDDSIVADFFAGSGTTLAVANKLNRRWIGCDSSNISIYTIMNRINRNEYALLYDNISNNNLTFTRNLTKTRGNIDIKITFYDYEFDTSFIRKKNKDFLSSIENFLYLIDYICIGYVDSLDIIIKEYYNLQGNIERKYSKHIIIEDKDLPIYIKVIDIFGNIYREIIY